MKLPKKRHIALGFVLFVAAAALAVWLYIPKPTLSEDIAMRDGVALRTAVYHPYGEGPWPTILMRTPYPPIMMTTIMPPRRYTDAGYAFILQSCRGTGKSEGEFSPFSHARTDAADTLDWVAAKSFCDGNIGLTGVSAMGITANTAASMQHPAVKAAYVALAPQSNFLESTFMGGVFKEAQVTKWLGFQDAEDLIERYRARPTMDDEWKRVDFASFYPEINVPVFNVAGWYDIFQRGNIANYMYLQNEGLEGARGNQKLRVGPFGHMGLSGDLAYPDAKPLHSPVTKDELRWFDHWLKGEDNGIMEEPRVGYYLMASARKGAQSEKNRVVETDTWPPEAMETRYYLHPELLLSTAKPTTAEAATTYKFDPENPVPTVGGSNLFMKRGPMDQREISEREDYLRFETPPLEADVIVAGPIEMELFASTDGLDTDFMVKLIDVYPDGYEALLLDAPIRARFRNGRNPEDVAMMEPGKPEKMIVDLWNTANVFEAGHRIAVHIMSSNAPRFEVNPNTGHAPGASREETRVATNSIHHSPAYPSAIVLPVLETLPPTRVAAGE